MSGDTISGQLQGLAPAARVFVAGNPGLCGGVPRPVLPLLGPLNGTSLAYPCFASPTLLPLAADASKVTLSASNQVPHWVNRLPIHTALTCNAESCGSAQVLYACDPDAQLLERFDPLQVTFQLTTAPQHGDLTVAGQTSPVAADTACAPCLPHVCSFAPMRPRYQVIPADALLRMQRLTLLYVADGMSMPVE